MMATLANGGTRVTPHLLKAIDDGDGLEAGAAAGAAVASRRSKPENLQAIRDGLWMVVNGAGTGGRARIDGLRRGGQDRHRAGHLESRAAGRAAGKTTRTCATTAGSCSSRRATTRRSPASCSPSTPSTASAPRRSRSTLIETFFAKKEGRPLPPPAAEPQAPPAARRTSASASRRPTQR